MSLSTFEEPDCSGMCRDGITFAVSAIASMTSSVNSAGCGLVKRTRSRPSMLPQARSSFENACRSPNSTPAAVAQGGEQLRKRRPVAELHAVGVDVLAQQGHLAHALGDERLDLAEDLS